MISSVDRRSEYVENRAGANVRLNNFLTPYTLDDKSSILNAPCGYSNGVYPSLRPVGGENLLTYSNDFSNGIWAKSNLSVALSNGAWEVTDNTTSGSHYIYWGGTTPASTIFTLSVEAKAGSVDYLAIRLGGFTYAFFDVANGTLGAANSAFIDTKIEATSNGFYKCSATILTPSSNSASVFYPTDNNGSVSYTGTGTVAITIKNAQLEKGYRATPYTDTTASPAINADFTFTRGSAATRVTKDGLIKNVQILSDELVQNGDFEQIGSELITNGDFATDLSGWIADDINATNRITWESNGARFFCTNQNIGLSQQNVLTIGKAYKLTCDVNVTTGSIGLDGAILVGGSTVNLVNGFNEIYFVANSTTFKIKRTSTVSDCLLDNVSVKEVGQNWTLTQSTIEDGKLLLSTTDGSYTAATQTLGTIGNLYKVSLNVSNIVGTISVAIGGGTDVNITTNGTHIFEITSASTTLEVKRKFGITNVSATIDNISLIEITDDTDLPRIDYLGGTGSLLLEPQSTNLLTYSEDFSQSYWSKSQISVVDDSTISPDGTQNASKIIINSSTPYLGNSNISLTTGNVYTISCFVKKGTNRWVRLSSVSSVTLGAWFDLDNNVVGTVNSTSASIENYGNGWYRISNTITAVSGGNQAFLGLSDADGGTSSTQQGNTVFAWGFQVEEQSFATSYIPTSGSTVTRNAEVCNNAGSSDLINSTEGVLYAEIAALADDATNRYIGLSDGTGSNRVNIFFDTNNVLKAFVSGTSSISSNVDITNVNKVAFKYKSGEIALWVNGLEADTSSSTFSLSGLNDLSLSLNPTSSLKFYGKVKSVAVFKEALTDEELAKITSTTQQEVFYEMRDRMLQIDADYYEFGDYTTRLKKLF
jgi:hypothetical protein